jgi:hypothetical protein
MLSQPCIHFANKINGFLFLCSLAILICSLALFFLVISLVWFWYQGNTDFIVGSFFFSESLWCIRIIFSLSIWENLLAKPSGLETFFFSFVAALRIFLCEDFKLLIKILYCQYTCTNFMFLLESVCGFVEIKKFHLTSLIFGIKLLYYFLIIFSFFNGSWFILDFGNWCLFSF